MEVGFWRIRKLRPATAFPFTLGIFSGTLITAFLCLALRSIDEEKGTVLIRDPGAGGRDGAVRMPPAVHVQEDEEGFRRQDQLQPRKLASYNVISSREALKTRGVAIYRTWGESLKSELDMYLFPPAMEEEINYALKRRMPIISLGSKKTLEPAKGRDTQGVFRTLTDICNKKAGSYQWFVKLQDDVYLRTKKLETLLSSLNSSEPLFIGHSVTPMGRERDELGFKEGENYCLEAGYVLSWRALILLCPMLPICQENAKSVNQDVEVARCIRNYVGANCTTSNEMRDLFYHAEGVITEEELQLGEHHLNPSIGRAILLGPLTEPDHFYHLHHYYSSEQLNSTKVASTRLRAHMIETAEKGAQWDALVHTSEHQSPPWTKLGVNSPFLPSAIEDLIHWQSLDNQYRYTEAKFNPSHRISNVERNDVKEVFHTVLDSSEKDDVIVDSILYRLDPQRGIDYFLHTNQRDSDDQYQAKFLHALRESEPPRVTFLDEASYKTTKVNFVIPTPSISRAFQRFMISFENSFLARKPSELVGLLVILYSDGKFVNYGKDTFAVITLLDLYKKKYPQADLRLVSTRRPYSRKESIELASKEYPTYELLFLADIHIDFSQQFLERCRMNAQENQQVYFPAVFSPYNPANFYTSRIRSPYATRFQISDEQGSWMHESFHLTCVYNYDLERVLELGEDLKESEWSLIDLFIGYRKLTIFRAVEPGLVHLWQDGCKEEELGAKEKSLCQRLQNEI